MAKQAKPETKPVAKAEKVESYKFGIDALAKELGIQAASVRVRLRNSGVKRTGKAYGWNSRADFDEVVKQLKVTAKKEQSSKAEPKKKAA